jgi:hypothetical protein
MVTWGSNTTTVFGAGNSASSGFAFGSGGAIGGGGAPSTPPSASTPATTNPPPFLGAGGGGGTSTNTTNTTTAAGGWGQVPANATSGGGLFGGSAPGERSFGQLCEYFSYLTLEKNIKKFVDQPICFPLLDGWGIFCHIAPAPAPGGLFGTTASGENASVSFIPQA